MTWCGPGGAGEAILGGAEELGARRVAGLAGRGPSAAAAPATVALAERVPPRLRRLVGGPTVAALLDQAVVSGGNFATAVLVGRFLGPQELGVYTLLVGGLLLAAAVQDATISTSFLTRRPELDAAGQRAYAGGCFLLSAAFAAAGGLLAGAAWELGDVAGVGGAFALPALLVPAFLLREQLRRYEFAYLRMGAALALDAVAVGLQLALLAGLVLAGRATLPACLGAMLAGNALAVALGHARRRGQLVLAVGPLPALLRDILHLSGWVLAALVLFVLALQAMPWLVAGRLGVEAAGLFAACAALANLGNPLLTGVINTMMPTAAAAFAAAGAAGVLPALRRDLLVLALATGALAAATVLAAPWLLGLVFGPAYAAHAPLAVVLALGFYARGLGAGAYVGCWALRRPAWNAAINLAVLAVAVLAALAAMPRLGVLGAGLGLLAGDLLGAAARWAVFLRLGRVGAAVDGSR